MSLVEEYYELNEAEKVSSAWKVFQIIFCAFAAALGLASGFTLSLVRLKFADRCYLFTEVKISHLEDHEKEHKIINWESDTWCDYYQFIMVSSFIVAIIWATLFLMCGKGGKSLTGLPQPWRIVWPSLIFNLIYFLIVLSTAIRIQQGTDYFCGRKQFENKKTKFVLDKCEPLKLLLKKDLHTTSVLLDVVLKTSWGCAASWLLLFVLSFLRIIFVIDFQLYKICVFKVDENLQNKKEEVLKITSYEEPKPSPYDDDEKIAQVQSQETYDFPTSAGNNIKDKTMRSFQAPPNRFPFKQTSTIYVAADIRILKLEEKRKKCLRALDEAFGGNTLRSEVRKPIIIPPNFETLAKPEMRALLHDNSLNLHYNEDDDSEMSSTSTFNKPYLSDDGETISGDFQSNLSLRFKKQI